MFQLIKRPIGLDDVADVRYLHGSAFKVCGAHYHSPEEINAFLDRINSNDYIQECLNCSLHGVWHNHMLIGTVGWCPSNDNRVTARVRKLYVHNFYVGLGIGRDMVENVEMRAKMAGFSQFSARASASSVKFFKSVGYDVSSHGALGLGMGTDIPVIYMRKNYFEKSAETHDVLPGSIKKPAHQSSYFSNNNVTRVWAKT